MILDISTRLAASEVVPNAGAAPGGLGAFSVASGGLDFQGLTGSGLRTHIDIGAGQRLQMSVLVNTTVTSATFLATLELQLVSIPLNATLLTNAAGSGKTLAITGVAASVSADTLTIANHGLPLGTPIHFTSIVTTTGIAANTIYFVVPTADPNTFKVATTLANALAGIAVDLLTGDGTVTVNFIPTIHATTGLQPLPVYTAGRTIIAPLMPLAAAIDTSASAGQIATAAQRLGYLRYVPSATITAGAFTVDVVQDSPDAVGLKHYPSRMPV